MIREYFIDHLAILLLNLLACFLLCFLLIFGGVNSNIIIIIAISWIAVYLTYTIITFLQYRTQKQYLEKAISHLDEKYLIADIIPVPRNYNQKIYYDLLKKASKSMNDQISAIESLRNEYQEYIENWIHEIKTPIAAIDLIATNSNQVRLKIEIDKIDYLVEQALFYARSNVVEKDYFIQKIDLEEVIQKSLLKHRLILLDHHFQISVEVTGRVYTDEKWLLFIFDQIISNAIKYSDKNQFLGFYSIDTPSGVLLTIEDHGRGIPESDLPRVFEKGFTGSNRSNDKSTGIGLYLAKKLSDHLGLSLSIESERESYTKVLILFPKGTQHILY